MGKNPAFQWYPGDWFREPGLQRVDLDVRGAWAELLMMMHHENTRGVSTGSITGLARQLRIDIPRACFVVEQLDINHIADVEYFDNESKEFIHQCANYFSGMSPECPEVSHECPYFVTIKNRRMVNEEKVKEYERLKKQRQRTSPANQGRVPKMSPSLSPSPSTPSPTPSTPDPEQSTKTLATVIDKSIPWPPALDQIRSFLLSIQAPECFFNQGYWLRIDQWLGADDSAVAYFDELKKYLAWSVAQNGHRRHKDMLRGFRNWLSTCERWRLQDAQRKAAVTESSRYPRLR